MGFFQSIDPFTLQIVEAHAWHSSKEIATKITKADTAFSHWRKLTPQQKGAFFLKLSAVLLKNKLYNAQMATSEMGKPIKEALAEVEKCALVCEYYAKNAHNYTQDQIIATEAQKTYITFQPLGIILGIMPWNFPFWQVVRFAIPTLMAGNTVLLKHAPNVLGCAKLIEAAFVEAGFPEGIFQLLVTDTNSVKSILEDSRVKGVSLTGSEKAGRIVGALAGANLKKSVLELGGSDAFLVLKDANIKKAAEVGLQSRLQNAGQVCISAKRFIVEASVKEQFVEEVLNRITEWKPADPKLESTKMGPMARIDLAENIEKQYRTSLEQGAVALTPFHREQCLVHPMILDEVHPNTVAFCEETFGPLVAIATVENEQEALAWANKSAFGLGATIFSEDIAKAEQLALQINAGIVFVNAQVKSDPRFPIGGINNSGYGRELSVLGVQEFTNPKTIYIA